MPSDPKPQTRSGKALKVIPAGDRRRLSDGRNAFRKMTAEQRAQFFAFMADTMTDADREALFAAMGA